MNISFALTTPQVRLGFATGNILKDVTRRIGWKNLKPGQILQAIEKGQGLKKGEHPIILGKIRVVSVRREPLNAITDADVAREGFKAWDSTQFVTFFCKANKCQHDQEVTRIEFCYL